MIIGSTALKVVCSNLNRKSKDLDLILTESEWADYCKGEFSLQELQNTRYGYNFIYDGIHVEVEIVEKRPSTTYLYLNHPAYIQEFASLDLCYCLKLSHRYKKNSPHFFKTRADILFMRQHGAKVPDELKPWLVMREKETYDYSHPTLNKTKGDFFKDEFYIYDHDTLHEAVKVFETPAFNFIKNEKAEVFCSRKKWEGLPFDKKIATVYEESAVLALERHQIPNNFQPDPSKSFKMALIKVCTSISSGWWREWAWENFDAVWQYYNNIGIVWYVQSFYKAKINGILKPHVPKNKNEKFE